jgi:hypothetical protein
LFRRRPRLARGIVYAAKMRAPRLPFSLLLPALDLVLWVFLALIPVTLFYYGYLADAEQDHHAMATAQEQQLHVTPQEVASQQLEVAMDWRGRLLTAVNLPGMFPESLTSLRATWPETWHPDALELFTWRSLVYPLYALPAWWFAGLSLDALLGRRRLHWIPMVLALLLFGFCALMAVISPFVGDLRTSEDYSLAAGMALWAVLFGIAPLAWWRQRSRDLAPVDAEPVLKRLS